MNNKDNRKILKRIKELQKNIQDSVLLYGLCNKYTFKELYNILDNSFTEIYKLKNQL